MIIKKIKNAIFKQVEPLYAYIDVMKILWKHKKKKHPSSVVFFMKNTCNSKCVMCGLDYSNNKNAKEISCSDYKTMLSHMEMDKVEEITFSGGGDPLLCNDLLEILDYTSKNYPRIELSTYTNGIALKEEIAEAFIKAKFSMIGISVNASTASTYREVMQVDTFEKVIRNVKKLVEIRNANSPNTKIRLIFVASMLNIDDLPGFINLAADLGVERVYMTYSRIYSKKLNLNSGKEMRREDSLLLHKEHSNKRVMEAECIAQERNIIFTREPLFGEKFIKRRCIWPWTMMMVAPEGEIYPCGAGEVKFYKAVEEKRLDFGNLLKKDINEFWNNEDMKKLRESSNYHNKNKPLKQCENCNLVWMWEGVDSEQAHFIELEDA